MLLNVPKASEGDNFFGGQGRGFTTVSSEQQLRHGPVLGGVQEQGGAEHARGKGHAGLLAWEGEGLP